VTTAKSSRVRWSRTLLVLVPLHVAAFALLYLGLVWLVEREIVAVQAGTAKIFALELIDDLHPVMESSGPGEIREALARFTALHPLLDLDLHDVDGRSICGGQRHLEPIGDPGSASTHFDLVATDSRWVVHAVVPIISDAACNRCHATDARLGAASMSYDVTDQVVSAHRRIRRSIASLGGGWLVLVAFTGLVSRRAARRWADRLRAEVRRGSQTDAAPLAPPSRLVLDPLSAELFATLRETLEGQRRREAQVVSSLHHSDRLASLGTVAAGLAHEIKNPIAGLHGALEILRDETGDDDQRRLFEQMLVETRRVNDTVQSLLALARPSSPRPRSTDIGGLLDDTVRLLQPSLSARGIALEHATAPDLGPFTIDRDQMRQVLVNLVTNAADAMDQGGTISIKAASWPDGDGLLLAVEDDGHGMSEDDQHRVFEPFFTTKHGGTGLGLAVSRTLVEQHGGTIELTSATGEGSTFLVLIPAKPGSAPDPGTDPS
jgi:signal transduction histidine kinase